MVARLQPATTRVFSTLGICKRLRIINMSVGNKSEKVGDNA